MENVLEYWKIEEGLDGYYDENGFAAYSVNGDEFYIGHFYVSQKANSYRFFKKIKEIAKEKGCKYMSGNLDINEYNKEGFRKKVMVHLGHGYNVVDVTDKRITVVYKLE